MPEMTTNTAPEKTGVKETGLMTMVTGPTFQLMMRQAMPSLGVTPERLTRVIATEFRKIPTLTKCSPASFYRAVIQCAELGLVPGSSLGQCFILPFRNKGTYEATFVLGYPGAAALAWRSDQVEAITARTVYEGERFKIRAGTEEGIEHEPATDWEPDRTVRGFYSTIRVRGASRAMFHYMSLGEILHFRDQYVRSKSGPWWGAEGSNEFRWMAQKTCFKQVWKLAPRSDELQAAFNADDSGTMGLPPEVDITDEANLLTQMMAEGEAVNAAGGFGAPAVEPEVLPAESGPKYTSANPSDTPCDSPIEGGCHRGKGHNGPCETLAGAIEDFDS